VSWANGYVGLPYQDLGRSRDGADCWGLVCLVYQAELGVTLPSYAEGYVSSAERTSVDALIDAGHREPIWRHVDAVAPFDVITLRLGRFKCHTGIVVRPGVMLHMAHGACAKLERYDGPRWRDRIDDVFRHVRAPDAEVAA